MWKLFLDDLRNVDQATELPMEQPAHANIPYTVLRSTEAALEYVREHGFPEVMALDHDLGGDDTTMRFLRALEAEYDLATIPPPDYAVHSANPVGAANIRSFMSSWLKVYTTTVSQNSTRLRGWECTEVSIHSIGSVRVKYYKCGVFLEIEYIPVMSTDNPWCVNIRELPGALSECSFDAYGATLDEALNTIFASVRIEAQNMMRYVTSIQEVFDYQN